MLKPPEQSQYLRSLTNEELHDHMIAMVPESVFVRNGVMDIAIELRRSTAALPSGFAFRVTFGSAVCVTQGDAFPPTFLPKVLDAARRIGSEFHLARPKFRVEFQRFSFERSILERFVEDCATAVATPSTLRSMAILHIRKSYERGISSPAALQLSATLTTEYGEEVFADLGTAEGPDREWAAAWATKHAKTQRVALDVSHV